MISPPNSTGAYELDLTLVDQFDLAWREMHVKTDVFCSGSIVLPDIAGRLINVGGWSLESTFGLRLYTPDGSPGVNGTNDWEENWEILSLQVGEMVGFQSQTIAKIYVDSADGGILLLRCCLMDLFSSLEVKLEVMLVLSQIWKFSQSLLAVTP
jgi:hypothetical protein